VNGCFCSYKRQDHLNRIVSVPFSSSTPSLTKMGNYLFLEFLVAIRVMSLLVNMFQMEIYI
jgi:hypothetical protein